MFTDLTSGWPGKEHDVSVFERQGCSKAPAYFDDLISDLVNNNMKDSDFVEVHVQIIGYSAYQLLTLLMKRFTEQLHMEEYQKHFNYRLGSKSTQPFYLTQQYQKI